MFAKHRQCIIDPVMADGRIFVLTTWHDDILSLEIRNDLYSES